MYQEELIQNWASAEAAAVVTSHLAAPNSQHWGGNPIQRATLTKTSWRKSTKRLHLNRRSPDHRLRRPTRPQTLWNVQNGLKRQVMSWDTLEKTSFTRVSSNTVTVTNTNTETNITIPDYKFLTLSDSFREKWLPRKLLSSLRLLRLLSTLPRSSAPRLKILNRVQQIQLYQNIIITTKIKIVSNNPLLTGKRFFWLNF